MSLKAFHIVFIAVSVLLSAVMVYWCLSTWRVAGQASYLVGATASLLTGVALIAWERRFLRNEARS